MAQDSVDPPSREPARLEYAPQRDVDERRRIHTASFCFWGCLLATPVAWIAALVDPRWHWRLVADPHLFAKLLFPYTMLTTLIPPPVVSGPCFLLAVVQFPLYGAILAMCALSSKQRVAAISLILAHATAATCCFLLHVR